MPPQQQGLSPADLQAIARMFAGARHDVELAVFRRSALTQAGQEFLTALAQVQTVAPRLRVSMREYRDSETLVERAPSLALLAADGTDLRVRFAGWPTGYEFSTLVATLADAMRGGTSLQPATLQALAELKQDVQIKVFTTPT
jgi:alkyl hydroperoxide reductase subunit AhpF